MLVYLDGSRAREEGKLLLCATGLPPRGGQGCQRRVTPRRSPSVCATVPVPSSLVKPSGRRATICLPLRNPAIPLDSETSLRGIKNGPRPYDIGTRVPKPEEEEDDPQPGALASWALRGNPPIAQYPREVVVRPPDVTAQT